MFTLPAFKIGTMNKYYSFSLISRDQLRFGFYLEHPHDEMFRMEWIPFQADYSQLHLIYPYHIKRLRKKSLLLDGTPATAKKDPVIKNVVPVDKSIFVKTL